MNVSRSLLWALVASFAGATIVDVFAPSLLLTVVQLGLMGTTFGKSSPGFVQSILLLRLHRRTNDLRSSASFCLLLLPHRRMSALGQLQASPTAVLMSA
jgi:hypothetical protein